MGCNGSTERPKKPSGAVRKKKTARRAAPGQRAQAPVQKSQVQSQAADSAIARKKTLIKSEPQVVASTPVVAEDPTKAAAGPVKKPTAQLVVSDNFNTEDISSIVADFKGRNDKEISGDRPESALLFDKDSYDTKEWSNLLFAVYNKDLRAVRYFIEHQRYHRRLSTRKRELGIDETVYEAEVFCLIIAISNQDKAMLDYLWSMNELWDYEHLKVVLQIIFTRNLWAEGIKILLGSEATQDIYNSLSYAEKKQFILELFYRYLHYAPEEMKEYIKEVCLERPYSLIAMSHIMTETDPVSVDFLEEVIQHVTMHDYAKMKYEAGIQFLKEWNTIYNQFIARKDGWESIAEKVKKVIESLDKEMERSKIFKSIESYREYLDKVDSAAEEGQVDKLAELIEECDIRNLRRTETSNQVLIPDTIVVGTFWNAIHIALFKGKLDVVKFLVEECRIDAASSSRLGKDKDNVDRSHSIEHEVFPMLLAVNNKDRTAAEYLWIEHEYHWNQEHLKAVINLIEQKEFEDYAGTVLNNTTSHAIFFAYLSLNDKLKFMEFLADDERKYASIYKKALLQKPYRWVYLLFRSKTIEDIDDKEAKELKKIGNDIKEEEFEIKDDEELKTYKTFIRNLATKVDEEDEQFKIFKQATSKLVQKEELEDYKADESEEDKILADIEEEDEEDDLPEEEEDDSDFSDDEFDFPTNEEICQWAEEGKLLRIRKVVAHKDFIDLNLIKGYENQVTIGEQEYNTELWNPMTFAINGNKLKLVKFFLEEAKINTRLALLNPDKQDEEYQEETFFDIQPLDEIQNLLIPVQNGNVEMFTLLWNSNHTVWTEEHFLELLSKIIEEEWTEGLKAFMESRTSREIFISLPFSERNKLFEKIMEATEEIEEEDIKEQLYNALAESPFSLGMIVSKFEDEDMEEYVKKAKGNFKEPEYNFIIFSEEVDTYRNTLQNNGEKEIADELTRYQGFMQTHYRIGINNAAVVILTPHTKEVELFKKEPRYAHLNLHAIAMTKENGVVWPSVKDQETLTFFSNHRWDLLSLALYSKNTDIFNSMMADTKPMTSMIFKLDEEETKDAKTKNEYVSKFQGLIQHSGDLNVLFNTMENHPSMFQFPEIYSMVKNILMNGNATEVKMLNSKAVKSWYAFMNEESRIKLIEEMFDWADENKATYEALGTALLAPLFEEAFEKADEEKYEEFKDKVEKPAQDGDADANSEGESEGDSEEASDEEESASDASGDDEENSDSSADEDEASEDSEEPSESVSV